jgi:hypothetical protein
VSVLAAAVLCLTFAGGFLAGTLVALHAVDSHGKKVWDEFRPGEPRPRGLADLKPGDRL